MKYNLIDPEVDNKNKEQDISGELKSKKLNLKEFLEVISKKGSINTRDIKAYFKSLTMGEKMMKNAEFSNFLKDFFQYVA